MFPVGMLRRRHLILQAVIKDPSKVTGAPLEVGKGPISIFPPHELETLPKELIEIYGPAHRLSAIGLRLTRSALMEVRIGATTAGFSSAAARDSRRDVGGQC